MDMTLWTLLALVLFLGLMFFLKVPSWIADKLDERSKHIADALEEARQLREQAQALLNECKQKNIEAEKKAFEIVESARREAHALAEQARQKMQEYIERRQVLAEQKIIRAEHEAIEEVKSQVIDVAIEAAAHILSEQAGKKASDQLFDESLKEIRSRFH